MTLNTPTLRADLHVHSYHSGYAGHLRFLRTRDCYSDPAAVYRVAKARGMDLVTITDHDSIDGCLEFLGRHPDAPDFFISEEAECRFPDLPLKLHIGLYGIDEAIHAEVRRLRADVHDVVAFLRERRVCFALNHMFFFLRRQMPVEAYVRAVLRLFPAFEVRNGAMLREQNELIAAILAGPLMAAGTTAVTGAGRVGVTGGSDAHTLRRIGTTYTEAEGSTRAAFLDSLRAGRSRVGGRHGTTADIATEIYGVIGRYWASLLGFHRDDLSAPRRAMGLAWSIASLPVEFVPLLVASIQKSSEARNIRRIARILGDVRETRLASGLAPLEPALGDGERR